MKHFILLLMLVICCVGTTNGQRSELLLNKTIRINSTAFPNTTYNVMCVTECSVRISKYNGRRTMVSLYHPEQGTQLSYILSKIYSQHDTVIMINNYVELGITYFPDKRTYQLVHHAFGVRSVLHESTNFGVITRSVRHQLQRKID